MHSIASILTVAYLLSTGQHYYLCFLLWCVFNFIACYFVLYILFLLYSFDLFVNELAEMMLEVRCVL